ncbi:hypothetical protein OAO42_01840 [Candidatus Izimaplasma bacterium]|nr:hypothetical protein [Candidatus Izimaplasma bacterium]
MKDYIMYIFYLLVISHEDSNDLVLKLYDIIENESVEIIEEKTIELMVLSVPIIRENRAQKYRVEVMVCICLLLKYFKKDNCEFYNFCYSYFETYIKFTSDYPFSKNNIIDIPFLQKLLSHKSLNKYIDELYNKNPKYNDNYFEKKSLYYYEMYGKRLYFYVFKVRKSNVPMILFSRDIKSHDDKSLLDGDKTKHAIMSYGSFTYLSRIPEIKKVSKADDVLNQKNLDFIMGLNNQEDYSGFILTSDQALCFTLLGVLFDHESIEYGNAMKYYAQNYEQYFL